MTITKAIIPAAGLGTRFLPYTKTIPKELLPIMNIPALQLIIEEGIASGITEFEIIANKNKHAIVDYFSSNIYLEEHLTKSHKTELTKDINTIISSVHFNYIPQPEPLGLGHAILMAEKAIGDNYFGISLPDEIMSGTVPALAQLIAIAQKYNACVIAVQTVPSDTVSAYGIVGTKRQLEPGLFEIDNLVEKPTKEQAPSNLAIVGRYILSPDIFSALHNVSPGAGNEIQLTDGIAAMIKSGKKVLAYTLDSTRHDIGNPLGWLQANLYYGLLHQDYSPSLKKYIKKLIP